MDEEIEKLEQEIRAAFCGRTYPGDQSIAVAEYRYPGSEAEATWKRFLGKDWREIVSVGREMDLRDDFACLTLEGLVYYLPAFMILSLDLNNILGPDEHLLHYLLVYREELPLLLDQKEGRAVVHLLEFLAREHEKRGYVGNEAGLTLAHYQAYFTEKS